MSITLSCRETLVMERMLAGVRLKDIAKEIKVTQSTVATYKSRIFDKSGVSNILALNVWRQENLLPNRTTPGTSYAKETKEEKVLKSFLILFGEDQYDFFEKCKVAPKRYRRILLDRFSMECDFSLEKEGRLHIILQWLCEIAKQQEL